MMATCHVSRLEKRNLFNPHFYGQQFVPGSDPKVQEPVSIEDCQLGLVTSRSSSEERGNVGKNGEAKY